MELDAAALEGGRRSGGNAASCGGLLGGSEGITIVDGESVWLACAWLCTGLALRGAVDVAIAGGKGDRSLAGARCGGLPTGSEDIWIMETGSGELTR